MKFTFGGKGGRKEGTRQTTDKQIYMLDGEGVMENSRIRGMESARWFGA